MQNYDMKLSKFISLILRHKPEEIQIKLDRFGFAKVNKLIEIETAIKVGQRHRKLSMLEINSRKRHEDGYKFFISENKVWLTDFVPIKYISILDV